MNLEHREKFVDLINQNRYTSGAEIGVRRGYFSQYILKNTCLDEWYAIDAWWLAPEEGSQQSDKQEAEDLLREFPQCRIVQKTSLEASKEIANDSLDFIYIDACHQYKYVKEDMEVWYPKVRSGGILAGHDYNPTVWPGVVDAVEEFVKTNSLKLFITGIGATFGHDGGDCNQPSWWFIKP